MNLARLVAILAVRADEAGQRDDAGVGKQSRHLADAANVFLAVGGAEAEILVQAVAHVVAVEHIGQMAAFDQRMLQREGDGAFSGTAEAGEPDRDATLLEQFFTIRPGDVAFVPGDVGCADFGHG